MLGLPQRLNLPDAEVDKLLRQYILQTSKRVALKYDKVLRDFSASVILDEQMASIVWKLRDGADVEEIASYTAQCWNEVTGGAMSTKAPDAGPGSKGGCVSAAIVLVSMAVVFGTAAIALAMGQ